MSAGGGESATEPLSLFLSYCRKIVYPLAGIELSLADAPRPLELSLSDSVAEIRWGGREEERRRAISS